MPVYFGVSCCLGFLLYKGQKEIKRTKGGEVGWFRLLTVPVKL